MDTLTGSVERITFYNPEARGGLKYVAGVHFTEKIGKWEFKLTMWADCERPVEQDMAKKIFRSIRFPKDQGTGVVAQMK